MQESIGTVDFDSLQDRSSLDPRIRRTIGFFDFGIIFFLIVFNAI